VIPTVHIQSTRSVTYAGQTVRTLVARAMFPQSKCCAAFFDYVTHKGTSVWLVCIVAQDCAVGCRCKPCYTATRVNKGNPPDRCCLRLRKTFQIASAVNFLKVYSVLWKFFSHVLQSVPLFSVSSRSVSIRLLIKNSVGMWAQVSFVLSQCTRVTDGRTDKQKARGRPCVAFTVAR